MARNPKYVSRTDEEGDDEFKGKFDHFAKQIHYYLHHLHPLVTLDCPKAVFTRVSTCTCVSVHLFPRHRKSSGVVELKVSQSMREETHS